MHEAQMLKQQGKKIKQIAEVLGKSERMIRYYLSEPSRSRKNRHYPSKLDPFKPYIDTILEDDPSFNREVLLRNLRKQKYTGGITILGDYAAKRASEITRKAVIRFETEPGYQAQVDWKVLGKRLVNGCWKKLFFLHLIDRTLHPITGCVEFYELIREPYLIKLGKNNVIRGQNARKITNTMAEIMNGNTPVVTELKLSPVVDEAVNKFIPNGGVIYPIQRFIQKTMPRCNGSIPSSIPIGTNIGAISKIATGVSNNAPARKRINESVTRNNACVCSIGRSAVLIAFGIPVDAIRKVNKFPAPRIKSIVDVVSVVLTTIFIRFLKYKSFVKNPKTSA